LHTLYRTYSEYLKTKYGQKVYKLPVNLPVTCPNRDGTLRAGGCIFCGEKGAGFENLANTLSVREQIQTNMAYIRKKYKAEKFIAYFQTYTSTYLPVDKFAEYMAEACQRDVVSVAVSTRPDCIQEPYLDVLAALQLKYGVDIDIELGLQTAKDDTLHKLNRGHTLADFTDAAVRVKRRRFILCTHLIIDLPWDTMEDVIKTARMVSDLGVDQVKLHSLYVVKDTELARLYQAGEVQLLTMEDYMERVIAFLGHLAPHIVIQRIIGRAPQEDTLIANWHTSWWKIKDLIEDTMRQRGLYQGCFYNER
jgi:radical SAM protein (TIGR01212 family)